jgi:hypothetical protein
LSKYLMIFEKGWKMEEAEEKMVEIQKGQEEEEEEKY